MREFTEQDWECYSGCDSEKPLIGECNVKVLGVFTSADVIVDGKQVEIMACFGGDDEKELNASVEFPSHFFAKNAAEWLIENKLLSVTMLEAMGFTVHVG